MRIISGNLGYDERTNDAERTDRPHDCSYSCDPIKGLGALKLSGPEFALGGSVIFFAAMYFSDQGLERRPFIQRHIAYRLLVAAGGRAFFLAVPLLIFHSLRLCKLPGHRCEKGRPQTQAHGDG